MSNFCDGKRKAVTEIGFGGVLHMPMNGNANLRHAVSLLSRVDLNSGTLPVGKDVRVQMSPEHIERLIGTPSRGRRVCGLDPDTPEERTDFVRLAMGSQRFYNDGLKAAELVVRREWDGSVTAERVEEFKVAFVVWIVGRFLAPSTKHDDHGCSDFWGSLYNANEIREYNWSAYFLAHIMGAAARVQSDIKNKRATTAMLISGCPLLLQVRVHPKPPGSK
uniref:Aminotransferase-like plant mobile domain-containing protein n=1 Tax=Aegilops tauschii TaxID=37682 RepID=N1QZK1_AEGTA